MRGRYKKTPSQFWPTLKYLGLTVAFIVVNKLFESMFPKDFVLTEEFEKMPFLSSQMYQQGVFVSIRYFYYIVFALTNGCINASGLGYSGMRYGDDGPHEWETVNSCDFYKVETAQSLIVAFQGWNQQIHVWLKNYVQDRLYEVGARPSGKAVLTTFAVSALWHGLYPSYFLVFGFAAIICEVSKDFHKRADFFESLGLDTEQLRKKVSSWLTFYVCSYMCIIFSLLEMGKIETFVRATKGIPIILTMVTFTICRAIGFGKKPRDAAEESEKKSQ